MAVTSVQVQRYDTDHVRVIIEVDGHTIDRELTIPDPLPDGYATNKEWVKEACRRYVRAYRRKATREANLEAQRTVFDGSFTNQVADATDILTDLQGTP